MRVFVEECTGELISIRNLNKMSIERTCLPKLQMTESAEYGVCQIDGRVLHTGSIMMLVIEVYPTITRRPERPAQLYTKHIWH